MINQTDLLEFETILPGDWQRQDNFDIYSFTSEKMEMKDERLFKELRVRHEKAGPPELFRYALSIEGDYCGVVIDGKEYIIYSVDRTEDGRRRMIWQDKEGRPIEFVRA
jgi:hypothetical protein